MNRFLLALGLLCTLPCHADVIQWQLQGVTFADGATATGTFDFETTTRSVIQWNIVTTTGTAPGDPFGPGFAYTPAVSRTNSNGLDTHLTLIEPLTGAPRHTLSFEFLGSLSTPAAAVPLSTLSLEIAVPAGTAFSRFVTAGIITAVPEPASWLLLASGIAGIVLRKGRGASTRVAA